MTQITNRIIKTQIKTLNELKPVCIGKFNGEKHKCFHCLWVDECVKITKR